MPDNFLTHPSCFFAPYMVNLTRQSRALNLYSD